MLDKTLIEKKSNEDRGDGPKNEAWMKAYPKPFAWKLVADRLEGKKVLEIGCNTGWLSYFALELGAKVVTTDIFDTNVYPTLHFVLAAKEDLPFPDNTFDFVLCSDVFHHGDELQKSFEEAHRILQPGGELISFIEPCLENEADEQEQLKLHCSVELGLGIAEHRPNLLQWKKGLSIFSESWIYYAGTLEEVTKESINAGICIRGVK